MVKCVSAVVMHEDGSWELIKNGSELENEFGRVSDEIRRMGVAIDAGLECCGLDFRTSISVLRSFCGTENVFAPLRATEIYRRVVESFYLHESLSFAEMSVGAFLFVCDKHHLGFVFI